MQTIGERLEEARKKKGITIREAAEATKIRGDYLTKFESNQFNIGLTDLYVRGFLRNYALYLHLPADRIVNDFSALGHAETRPRQPSREVYGRMDLSVSGGDEREERRGSGGGGAAHAPAESAAGAADSDANPARTLRPHASGLPTPRVDPTLIFKGAAALVAVLVLIAIIWLLKSLFSSSPKPAEHPGLANPGTAASAPATQAPAADADGMVTLVAKNAVNVRVSRLPDGVEIFSGQLSANQRLPCPNVGLSISAGAIESLSFEYHGARFQWGQAKGPLIVQLPVQH